MGAGRSREEVLGRRGLGAEDEVGDSMVQGQAIAALGLLCSALDFTVWEETFRDGGREAGWRESPSLRAAVGRGRGRYRPCR